MQSAFIWKLIPKRMPGRLLAGRCFIYWEAVSSNGGLSTEGSVDVMVTLDPKEQTRLLIAQVERLRLEWDTKKILLAKLRPGL